jgi:hypothetical protein
MPPFIKKRAMKKMAARVEAEAEAKGLEAVGLDEVYVGCAEILARKEEFMLESLTSALRDEGYEPGET